MAAQAERELLTGHGHEVDLLEAGNSDIVGLAARVKAAAGTIYSPEAKKRVAASIDAFHPDVVHVHNFFPLLSPSIYYACREAGVPVVQTLHNYRLICPNALLLRSGRPCEDCVGRKFAWPGVLHGCYRGSPLGTATVAAMASTHRWLGTWHKRVDSFIALSEFAKSKLAGGGLPVQKITVKPNFLTDPGTPPSNRGKFALFVGRLSLEKGIATLLSVWERLGGAIPLKIAGDGPLKEKVAACSAKGQIEYLGSLRREEILGLMSDASLLIFPSLCYENFPLVMVEAFAHGLPVIASQLGAMGEIIKHGRTGLHFRPGDAEDLAAKVEWAWTHPAEMENMGRAARAEYEAKYTPERNYQMLMNIYDRVTGGKFSRESDRSSNFEGQTAGAADTSERGRATR